MRTGNISVDSVLAQAQAKLASSTQQATSTDKSADTEALGKISPVLAQVQERITAQAQTVTASLSALGSFKSGLADLGTAAKGLATLSASSTPEAIQSALTKLVTAYNATLKSSAAAGNDAGTSRTLRALDNAVDALDTPRGNLAKLGIGRQTDGALTLDSSALGKAVASGAAGVAASLSVFANSVSGASTEALADDGRLSNTLERLGNRSQALKDQQAAVLSTATRLSAVSSAGSSLSAMALAAYRNAG
ncbi:flagellar hook protein [Pseudorhodoferax sp.]|uniref:flagellar hook protein n=1 Tax=Pseudorhodoferax sp. TaxID=1993553 RepID=UPI002DD64EA1|nr:flagellar hook protein [Pseudorhodoferax sp.]